MLQPVHAPTNNRLLVNLSGHERQRLLAGCQRVELSIGEVLCKHGERMRHIFFPLDSCISLLAPGVASLDAALIGDEGMLGAPLVLGLKSALLQGQVQYAGQAWRMETKSFLRELEHSQKLRQMLNRYLYVILAQSTQTAACTRFHVVEARLARWLLMSRDRMHSDGFPITHERLADSLGVRRAGITRAASSLQHRTLIRYRRGNLRILDGRGLEAAACSCYAADKEIYRRLMR